MIFKKRVLTAFAILAILVSGCQKRPPNMTGTEALQLLRRNVQFNTNLSAEGEDASVFFPELPRGCEAVHYGGSGYYADEIMIITLSQEKDRPAVIQAVQKHLGELRTQFLNYIPEEVDKIDNAVIFETEHEILLCITNDYVQVNKLLKGSRSYISLIKK